MRDSVDAMRSFLEEIAEMMMPPDKRAAGWRYMDFPPGAYLSLSAWDEFIALLGEGNYELLASANVDIDGTACRRGAFYVSPQAMANMEKKYQSFSSPIMAS